MNPRRRHKAKARRAGRGVAPVRRMGADDLVEMRIATALLVLPTWWHGRVQQCARYDTTITIRRQALGWTRDQALANNGGRL